MSVSRDDLAICVLCSSRDVLESCLLRSPCIESIPTTIIDDAKSASEGYNRAMEGTKPRVAVCVHQDVYLPASWIDDLLGVIEQLGDTWGVIGSIGKTGRGDVVGRVFTNGLGKEVGCDITSPTPIVTLDEMVLVINAQAGVRFDAALPGFHLYGTDVVRTALAADLGCFAADLPAVHNSVPVGLLDAGYKEAYRYLSRKYRRELPLETLIVSVTRFMWPVYRFNLRRRLRGIGRERPAKARHADPAALARQLGYAT